MIKKEIIIVILIILGFGCTKRYEEDPFTARFFSMKKRLTGEWYMKKILIDEQDFSHLIEMENDTFYAIYKFSDFSKNLYAIKGKIEIKTINEKFISNQSGRDLFFYLYPENKYEYICFRGKSILSTNKYGIINNFDFGNPYLAWQIDKLTLKKMHLHATYDSREYDLFFEKK
jgi:hypothetical protein